MKPFHRSLSGLVLAVLAAPIFMSLIACLPVPIGDPEKSRIDPELSGIWVVTGGDPGIVLFEPYDKRTWLVTMVEFDWDDESCPDDTDNEEDPDETYEALMAFIEAHGVECFVADDEVSVYKAWRTRLAKKEFMTWEMKGVFDDDRGFTPEFWWGFRIDKADDNEFALTLVDIDYDGFNDLEDLELLIDQGPPHDPKTLKAARRAVEKVIRKNVDDEDLYGEGDALHFHRLSGEHLDLFGPLVAIVVSDD